MPKLSTAEKRGLYIRRLEEAIEEHGTIKREDYEEEVSFLSLQICYDALDRADKKKVQNLWPFIKKKTRVAE